ncbi:MAG: hypothetical protein A2319_00905 [Candidatus Kerfeldbacteria bacterium RIFOXYB2_FULL_38_14]|uniref:AAA+ ATPase domain-containing protein n=1 Tax=Candidatus Kerfeldbacteria bacterium RIFOXYB2_FULL_38_14 TaxID=1798547 RepID=A0A1G2BC97_9BACT|nr:MAG: hypothetical protein A2319_00905 [Candidatus Kerfeldbacteria bacterium RIFOXYB2_FULL_38_14]
MQKILEEMNPWWSKKGADVGIRRDNYLAFLEKNLQNKEILMLLGSRRVGKTTIMKQWIEELMTKHGVAAKQILYVFLDHPQLEQYSIIDIVNNAKKMLKIQDRFYVFLDEIQYRKKWDQELKALYELGNIKFLISGSAITLLNKQKTFLTGRYLKQHVYPLNFLEFQEFSEETSLNNYLKTGGYPEYVLQKDPQYLFSLIDHVVYKDIVEVYGIRNPKAIADLLLILARSAGHRISLNKIANTLKIAIETVRDYLHYLEEVYLIFSVPKFSRSLNEQLYNQKKYYFYDNGLCRALNGQVNLGSLAENLLANNLRQSNRELYYFYEKGLECDFVTKELSAAGKEKFISFESKFLPPDEILSFSDDRLQGFYQAMDKLLADGIIVTNNQTDQTRYANKQVRQIPLQDMLCQTTT